MPESPGCRQGLETHNNSEAGQPLIQLQFLYRQSYLLTVLDFQTVPLAQHHFYCLQLVLGIQELLEAPNLDDPAQNDPYVLAK